ncbi:MAG: hypothetical protein LW707_03575 [Sphingobacteriales bacterium]|nr:hypothetical protein [Sphingobacteriales bacterium]
MTSFFEFLNSSVGRKWLMALTGLFLCIFLVVHVSGNLQLFKDDNGMSFNQYSVFMTTFTPIKVVSYLLYATVIVHAINGFYLMGRNRKARPVAYASTWPIFGITTSLVALTGRPMLLKPAPENW